MVCPRVIGASTLRSLLTVQAFRFREPLTVEEGRDRQTPMSYAVGLEI